MFTDDAIFEWACTSRCALMGAVHIARRGAAAFLTAVGKSHEAHQFELKDFVAQANKVTVLGYQKGQAEPIG
jgi:hypothetical protein